MKLLDSTNSRSLGGKADDRRSHIILNPDTISPEQPTFLGDRIQCNCNWHTEYDKRQDILNDNFWNKPTPHQEGWKTGQGKRRQNRTLGPNEIKKPTEIYRIPYDRDEYAPDLELGHSFRGS